jgi:hypothetical protein
MQPVDRVLRGIRIISDGSTSSSSANSSSARRQRTRSLAETSASCGPAKPVFISTSRTPILFAALRATMMSWLLRLSTPITSPGWIPLACNARANAFEVSSSWRKLTVPRSSVIAGASA